MRTNIVLDERLVQEAFRLTDARTKKELIHLALEELIRVRRKRNLAGPGSSGSFRLSDDGPELVTRGYSQQRRERVPRLVLWQAVGSPSTIELVATRGTRLVAERIAFRALHGTNQIVLLLADLDTKIKGPTLDLRVWGMSFGMWHCVTRT